MFEPVFELLIGIVIAVVFFFAGVFFSRKIAEKALGSAETQAKQIIEEAN
ncbi:MAG TPA: hypothetical protein DD733_05625, partial [Clostridiales bacterium]|nr:hypothetical protein [Clostridiales bacterium]